MTDKKKASGPTITNAKRRERGLTRVCVWLSPEDVARLDALAPDRAKAIRMCLANTPPDRPARTVTVKDHKGAPVVTFESPALVLGFAVEKGPDGKPRLLRKRPVVRSRA